MGKSANETLKEGSNYLRGTILDGLAYGASGSLTDDDQKLTKFHGIYQQDDRDLRRERRKKKLEPVYSFMIRVRAPGGVATAQQWLEMDRLAHEYANGTLKITTRQTFQFHGVIKNNLKRTIYEINQALFDTIAACGDVNRNVVCNPCPIQTEIRDEINELANKISTHLLPRSGAYHDIWIGNDAGEQIKVTRDAPLVGEPADESEPIYSKAYLPRKFKIVIAVPPSNDVDIFGHDLGFIAILNEEQNKVLGYNVTIGGGMGMIHGKETSFPRLADVIGFCTPDQVLAVAESAVRVQRDYGNRDDRANARVKYTVERLGVDRFRSEIEALLGSKLEAPRPFVFEHNGDNYGWLQDHLGYWHYCLYIENGRIYDQPDYQLMTGMREIAKVHKGEFRMTTNQNVIIANIAPEEKPLIEKMLKEYKMYDSIQQTGLRLHSMSCVALPTCGLALAEAQRFLPTVLASLEEVMEEAGLRHDAITIRMTGCPNGCARPYIAEIGFVGKGPDLYNIYLGGGFTGDRLNTLYYDSVKGGDLVKVLRPIIIDYAHNRLPNERFGDFVIRAGYVKATLHGRDFQKITEATPKDIVSAV